MEMGLAVSAASVAMEVPVVENVRLVSHLLARLRHHRLRSLVDQEEQQRHAEGDADERCNV